MRWLSLLLFPLSLFALPKGAAPVSGSVHVESLSSSKMAVHASDRSIIHWDQFSIQAGEKVKFVQPHSGAASFNHVVGGQASQILGMLKANGHVYLINPNGVLIGKSGVINAASFTASTLDLLDHKQGELRFKGSGKAQLINYGRVEALEGDVILMGSSVINEGELIASQGKVALGAGSEIILRPESQERLFIVSKRSTQKEALGIDNQGSIEAAEAELKADGNVYRMAIKHSGVIEAGELQQANGRILLVAERGVVESSGEMVAAGGTVHLLGEKVGLTGKGSIDVSHESGGGVVLLGGDYQGGTGLRSRLTFIEEGARISASAIESGDGGKVVAWSDGGTVFHGQINAEGGSLGGDGGFVEVSGVEHLNFSGLVSTLAPQGITGTLLLDPTNVTISAAADVNATFAGGTYTYNSSSANIRATDLATNLATSDVIVSTTSSFSGAGTLTVTDHIMWNSANSLTLISDGEMTFDGVDVFNMGSGDLSFHSGGGMSITNNCVLDAAGLGANLTITAGGSVLLEDSNIIARNGVLSVDAKGDLWLKSGVVPSWITSVNGRVEISVGGDLTIAPSNSQPAHIGTPIVETNSNADITISSIGGNLTMIATDHFAQIGHSCISNVGNIIIGEIGGDLILQGGTATNAYAQIGHSPNGNNFTLVGDVTVGPVLGKILIQGGTGDYCQALIGHGFLGSINNGSMAGAISVSQQVVPATGNDLLLQSGPASAASAGIGFIPTQGTVSVLSERVSVDTNAPITLLTVDGNAQTVIGVFESNIGLGSALIQEISVKTSRDLILQPGNGTGNTWGGAIIGTSLPTPNVSDSTINIEARDMFWLGASLGFPIVINHTVDTGFGTRDITITTRNIFMGVGIPDSQVTSITTGRNLLLVADQDIQLGPGAVIQRSTALPFSPPGSGEFTFVVDNAFPSSPDIGPGQFISDSATVQTRGPLRIFTARRPQNVINGPIKFDGSEVFFVPGPLLENSATEQWGVYFPDSFGGNPFTIFYKEVLPPFVNLYGRAISDMFKNLATYDEFLFAPKCFLLGFDNLWYDEPLHLHGEVSSFDLFHDKTYQLLRPRYRNYQTKYVESF